MRTLIVPLLKLIPVVNTILELAVLNIKLPKLSTVRTLIVPLLKVICLSKIILLELSGVNCKLPLFITIPDVLIKTILLELLLNCMLSPKLIIPFEDKSNGL